MIMMIQQNVVMHLIIESKLLTWDIMTNFIHKLGNLELLF